MHIIAIFGIANIFCMTKWPSPLQFWLGVYIMITSHVNEVILGWWGSGLGMGGWNHCSSQMNLLHWLPPANPYSTLGWFAAEHKEARMRKSTLKSKAMVLNLKNVAYPLKSEVSSYLKWMRSCGLFTIEERMERDIDGPMGEEYWSVLVNRQLI